MSDHRNRFSDTLNAARLLQEQLRGEGYDDADVIGALESETQVLDLMDRTIERVISDERLAASAKERARRLEARAENRRGLLHVIMRNLERDNIERPLGTVYYQGNPPSLSIDNADDIPSQYLQSVPDKARLLAALKALKPGDEAIPGVSLKPPSRHLRIKTT